MKKLICLILSLIILLGLCACGVDDAVTEEDEESTVRETTGQDDDGDNKKTVITIGIPQSLLVDDYETNAFTLWLEQQANVDLRFHLFPAQSTDYKTQLSNLALAQDSKLPDILVNFDGLPDTAWKKYGKDEKLLPLTDYFEDKEGKGKAYWDAVKESGISEAWVNNILSRCKGDDGEIYCFPHIETSTIATMGYQAYINQEWLNALNLKMPTDPDSLYKVLKAFKTEDPNKNGFPDEYPLIGGSEVIDWIINMFVYYDDTNWFNLSADGRNVKADFTSNAYREAMIYLNRLHSEGLIHYDWNWMEIWAIVNSNNCSVGVVVSRPDLTFDSLKNSIHAYAAIPVWGYAVRKEYNNYRENFITRDAADVMDKCWELLCLMCTKEGSYRQLYGEKGIDWVDADPGAISILGGNAEVKLLKESVISVQGNECWKNVAACLLPYAEGESVQLDRNASAFVLKKYELLSNYCAYYKLAQENNNPKYIMPDIVRSEAEREKTQNERANCQSVILQYRILFIRGELNPEDDAHWLEYLTELTDLGLSVWLMQTQEIYQSRYMASVLSGA